MSNLSLAIIVTGSAVILAYFALMRLGTGIANGLNGTAKGSLASLGEAL
ncbi:hypothetical protein LV475_05585 [Guyparkeria hydrothermalis]|nr:hypothetical protein [Guyparkeria hydrothermalis]MCL7751065.1 hypothetical protein [Guyparkeria hydrothermalis]